MTCIAAFVDNKGVGHIAADSLGSSRYTKGTYVAPKIFAISDMLIGFAGSYRLGQLLQYRLQLPAPAEDQDFDSWLHVDFLDAVRTVLLDNGGIRVQYNEEETTGQFLIVVAGRIFMVQEDLSILESTDRFEAVGSGADYARATMNAALNHRITNPTRVLTEAIEAAAKYVPSVGGEIHMLSETG